MPTPKKIATVEKLASDLRRAKSTVLVDYQGLSTAQIEDLRAQIEEAGGSFTITKNTLLDLALKQFHPQTSKDSKPSDSLTGPTAALFSFEDEVTAIRALAQFIANWQLPQIKAGLLADRLLDPQEVEILSQLPGRQQLLAQVLTQINAPRIGLVWALNFHLTALAQVLQQISKSKQTQS